VGVFHQVVDGLSLGVLVQGRVVVDFLELGFGVGNDGVDLGLLIVGEVEFVNGFDKGVASVTRAFFLVGGLGSGSVIGEGREGQSAETQRGGECDEQKMGSFHAKTPEGLEQMAKIESGNQISTVRATHETGQLFRGKEDFAKMK
jgi:hypothetical protein